MQSFVFNSETLDHTFQDLPIPTPGAGEVVVNMRAAALNHRDLNMPPYVRKMVEIDPSFPRTTFVVGADGAGTISAVGEGVTSWQVGDAVILNCLQFCGTCPACLSGEHTRCKNDNILGSPGLSGTFAPYVKVPVRQLIPKPEHLTFEEAAALPMALGTAWRAVITRAALQPGETVLIQGIGGGVALFALQIATAMGARAIVTSSSNLKLDHALALGAAYGINYREDAVAERVKELTNGLGADVVIDGGGAESLPIALQAVRDHGRVVNYGLMTGRHFEMDAYHLFIRQVSLLGSAMFNHGELADALRFIGIHGLKPVISAVYPFEETEEAVRILQAGTQFGKVVVTW